MSAVSVRKDQDLAQNVVLPSNINIAGNMDELEQAVFNTLKAIFSNKEPDERVWLLLVQKLRKIPLICARRVLARGAVKYNNPYHEYPSIAFWREMISDVMREERMKEGTFDDGYQRPSAEETMEVVQMAREMAEKFESMKKEDHNKGGAFSKKLARYRGYIKNDLVGIEYPYSVEWLPRRDAEKKGVKYIDPIVWMQTKVGLDKSF